MVRHVLRIGTGGKKPDYGKLALSHPASATNRYGVQIHVFDDAAMTVGDVYEP